MTHGPDHRASSVAFVPAIESGVDASLSKHCMSRYSMSSIRRAFVVEGLFPPGVIAFECYGDASPEELFPSERECIARSVARRAREFAAGRLCARAGLTVLGYEPGALLSGRDRAPMWPSGVVGSITHTDGYCVAVVSLEVQFAAVGVDAERVGQMSPSLWRLTMCTEELSRVQSLEAGAGRRMATIIFSAKEAFYKCQYVLTRRWLGFEDVIVDTAGEVFEVSVFEPTHPMHYTLGPWIGRFRVDRGLVVAGIAAERRGRSRPPS